MVARVGTIIEVIPEGWDRLQRDINNSTGNIQRLESTTIDSSTRMKQTITALSSSFLAIKEAISMGISAVDQYAERLLEWNKFSHAMNLTARELNTTQEDMIDLVTKATRGQADNMREVSYAVNLLVRDAGAGYNELDEFMQRLTTRALEMGVEIDDAFSTVAEDITTGGFSDSLVRLGFDVETMKSKFDTAGSDLERFNIILNNLREDTELSSNITLESGESWHELSVVLQTETNIALQELIRTLGGVESISDITESVRSSREEFTIWSEKIGDVVNSLRRLGGQLQEMMLWYTQVPDIIRELTGNVGGSQADIERAARSRLERIRRQAELEQNNNSEQIINLNEFNIDGDVQSVAARSDRTKDLNDKLAQQLILEQQVNIKLDEAESVTKSLNVAMLNRINQMNEENKERELRIENMNQEKAIEIKTYEIVQARLLQQQQQLELQRESRVEMIESMNINQEMIEKAYGEATYNRIINGVQIFSSAMQVYVKNFEMLQDTGNSMLESFRNSFTQSIIAVVQGEKSFSSAAKEILRTVVETVGEKAIFYALENFYLAIQAFAQYNFGAGALHMVAALGFAGLATAALGVASILPSQSTAMKEGGYQSSTKGTQRTVTESNNVVVNINSAVLTRDGEEAVYKGVKSALNRRGRNFY